MIAPVVVMCRPQMGENVGTAARAMLNFGLTELRLVRPDCGWPNVKAVVASSGAYPVLNGVEAFATLEAALHDVHHVFATTARPRDMEKPVLDAAAAAREAVTLARDGRRVALLFGAERSGLSNDEILLADAIVSYPVNPDFASLNLAQAVLLTAYEWFKAAQGPAVEAVGDRREPATKAEVAGLIEHLVAELDEVDFFRSPGRRASLVATITLALERRLLSKPEVSLFRGIVKDLAGGRKARATAAGP